MTEYVTTSNIFMWAQANILWTELSLQTCLFKMGPHTAQASLGLTFSCLSLPSARIIEPAVDLPSPKHGPASLWTLALVQQIPNSDLGASDLVLQITQVLGFPSELPSLGFILWLISAPNYDGHGVSTLSSISISSRKPS